MNFIFLRFKEVWTQRVPCKLTGRPSASALPYVHEPQTNEIYFLNEKPENIDEITRISKKKCYFH